jgi:hypothetical protein
MSFSPRNIEYSEGVTGINQSEIQSVEMKLSLFIPANNNVTQPTENEFLNFIL